METNCGGGMVVQRSDERNVGKTMLGMEQPGWRRERPVSWLWLW